ncbi:hypothetical protein JCM3770_003746 [Rhodotorula araucariae]
MPPLKLPKKGKGRQVHIDFASPETARASAPSDWAADEWLDEGTRQEEQGERYQAGAKAARHYSNAATCYALASAARPADFDSRYNAARVWQTLATEHLAAPDCLTALDRARQGYREALAVLVPGAEGEATARIDALFNLAQADVALFEMLEDAVAPVDGERERALQVAREARELFVEVERLQREEMVRFFGTSGPAGTEDDTDDADEMKDAASSGTGGAETSVRAVETTIVTPQLIVDTLLESVAFDLALYDSSISDPATQAELRQSALDSFARATALRASVPGEATSLDFELAFAQATMLTTLSPDEATPFIEQLAASSPPKVDLLSLGADHLIETLDLSSPLPSILATLARALDAYESAHALLANRLSPPRDIPASHLPSLLSANLVAQSTVHLVSYELLSRGPEPGTGAPSTAAQHLAQAHALALAATSAPRSGLSLALSASASASASSPSAPPAPGTRARAPALALARAPPSTDPRGDWRTRSALRTGLFALARVRLRMDPSPSPSPSPSPPRAGTSGDKSQFWALWRALGLARGAGGDDVARVREIDARWWAQEVDGDKVMEAMAPEAAQAEREYWEGLASA